MDAAGQAARAETLYRAHSIWLGHGRPENTALADWLQVEAEVAREVPYPVVCVIADTVARG